MTDALSVVATPAAAFDGFLAGRRGEPPSLLMLRRRAMDRFAALGLPSQRQEEWRFTNLAPLSQVRLEPAPLARTAVEVPLHRWPLETPWQLVFVDGSFAPHLSAHPADLPDGVSILGLAQAVERHPARVEPFLGQQARFDHHPFVALNTAFHRDGAFVELAAGVTLADPVHLLFVSSERAAGRTVFPRALVVAGEGSRATVVETYVGAGGLSLTCPVTEIALGRGAEVDHYRVQDEDLETSHVASVQALLERDTRFVSHSFSLGAGLARTDLGALLDGEGASATLNGLYLVSGTQHCDTAMRVRHAQPHGTSRELYKGILDGRGRAVFTGRIVVDQDAQKSDAVQSNRNLLLSDTATVNSNPQLEILADDVRCTHGSAVGRLDEEALFYLRARGLDHAAAQSLLTWAFASEVVEGVRLAPLRAALTAAILSRLPHGELVREAA